MDLLIDLLNDSYISKFTVETAWEEADEILAYYFYRNKPHDKKWKTAATIIELAPLMLELLD